jgi:geranylgeranyl pyrophosphate synthase
VKLNGMDASKAEAERLCDKAVSALRALPYDTKFLLFLAGFLVNRDY